MLKTMFQLELIHDCQCCQNFIWLFIFLTTSSEHLNTLMRQMFKACSTASGGKAEILKEISEISNEKGSASGFTETLVGRGHSSFVSFTGSTDCARKSKVKSVNNRILSSMELIYITQATQIIEKMDEAARERKQQYLREKILDKNYDPEQFMDYCEAHLGSVNIDEWSFEKLQNIVRRFIDSQSQFGDFSSSNDNEFAQNNEFGSTFSATEYSSRGESPNKNKKEIEDQFSSWGNFIHTQPPKKEESQFQLNLLDLDFLMGDGKSKNTVSSPPPPQKNNQKSEFMSVPGDIVKKLQEGNQGFIVGYNPSMMQGQKSEVSREQPLHAVSNQPIPQSRMNIPPRNNNELFSKQLECKKVMSKSKFVGNESISVTGHEIINPNIFVPKYVLYTITTHPLNCEVKRRFKDFQNLRNLLKKFFPLTHIPHLERCSRLSETEPEIVKKQNLFIESFINTVLMKKELKCKLVEEFLMCKDLDLLKKIFKEYEKLSKPKNIEGLFTPSGSINLKISSENRKYVEQQTALNDYLAEYFTKMKTLYDELVFNFERGMRTLSEIELLHTTLNSKIKTMNTNFTPEYQCPQIEKSLQRISYMHKQWSNSFKTQARVVQSQIRHLYRYERDNIGSLKQLLKVQEDFSDSFWKRSDREQANEDYLSRRLGEFKMVIDNPSKNFTVLKHQYAFVLEKSCQECLNYLTNLSEKFDSKYKLFCVLQMSISNDMEGIWKNFDSFYK